MLPHEIEPFAQTHIKNLKKIREELLNATLTTDPIPNETVNLWADQLLSASHAFYRFQVCMLDEHKMKNQEREKAFYCRLNHQ